MNIGSGERGELTFLDVVALLSYIIGVENLEMNITQSDVQEQTKEINRTADERVDRLLSEIHSHLEMQDKKLDAIIQRLEKT